MYRREFGPLQRAQCGHPGIPCTKIVPGRERKLYPPRCRLARGDGGLETDSIVLIDHLRTVDKRRFHVWWGRLPVERFREIEAALVDVLGLDEGA